MARKKDRARAAGVPTGRETARGETQRESSARMSAQRIANSKRIETKRRHLELDPKTGRPKR